MPSLISRLLRAFFGVLAASSVLPAWGQQADQAAHDRMCQRLRNLYNAGDHAGIHRLLTPSFQKELDAAAAEAFFGRKLQEAYGRFEGVTFSHVERGWRVYELLGEKAVGTLRLVVNREGQVAGLVFQRGAPQSHKKSGARQEPSHDNPLLTEQDRLVHAVMTEHFRENPVPCVAVGVTLAGERRVYNYGTVQPGAEAERLPTQDTIFEIGSITKTFTGLLLAQAVVEGRTTLEAPVAPLVGLPAGSPLGGEAPVRLVHLANHTSGLPRLTNDMKKQPGYDAAQPYQHHDWRMISAFLGRVKLKGLPGEHEDYSNLGFAVLGRALVILLGDGDIAETGEIPPEVRQSAYGRLVAERICRPLGLKDTALAVTDPTRFAPGHDEEGNPVPPWIMGDWAPAGGLRSSVRDLLTYLETHLRPLPGQEDVVRQVLTKTHTQGREAVGLGWQMTGLKDGRQLVWHNGGTQGSSSFCGFVASRKLGIVVLSNSDTSVDGVATKLFRGIAAGR